MRKNAAAAAAVRVESWMEEAVVIVVDTFAVLVGVDAAVAVDVADMVVADVVVDVVDVVVDDAVVVDVGVDADVAAVVFDGAGGIGAAAVW